MPKLCAITCYFNPQGYKRRRFNFLQFRKHLKVPLVTVELGFSGRFELTKSDADILVQIPGKDVMWQKECLLNLALKHIPDKYEAIAWLDCDVVFERDDWHELATQALEEKQLVQLFSEARYMGRNWTPGLNTMDLVERVRPSVGSALWKGLESRQALAPLVAGERPNAYTGGLAWALRREVLENHGLYDANILGGGDRSILGAALGEIDYIISWNGFSDKHADHFKTWANAFFSEVAGKVSGIEGVINHLWHGVLANRGYGIRNRFLQEQNFDPNADVRKNSLGVWEWSSKKKELHRYVADYFAQRKEDG